MSNSFSKEPGIEVGDRVYDDSRAGSRAFPVVRQ